MARDCKRTTIQRRGAVQTVIERPKAPSPRHLPLHLSRKTALAAGAADDHIVISGVAVRIEPQSAAHADGLFEAIRDERIYEFLDDAPPKSVKAVRERIERLLAGAPETSGEIWMNWTVFDGENVVGFTQATILADGTASLAYVLSPSVWGRSVAHAACLLTIADIKDHTAVVRFVADTEVDNKRSQALLGRLGFRQSHTDGPDVFYTLTSEQG